MSYWMIRWRGTRGDWSWAGDFADLELSLAGAPREPPSRGRGVSSGRMTSHRRQWNGGAWYYSSVFTRRAGGSARVSVENKRVGVRVTA